MIRISFKVIGNIIRKHGLCYHCYADDTQIYIAVKDNQEWDRTRYKIEACVSEIRTWMQLNMLKLSGEKTETIIFTPNSARGLQPEITIDNVHVSMSKTVKNLGVILDRTLSKEAHITQIVRTTNHLIRNLWHVRKYLTTKACKTVIQGTVISRLDYCNSLLHGLPKKQTHRLQRAQNNAARLILKTKRRDHITPVLKELHWLPVTHRITYKLLTITYKTLFNNGPQYLKELLPEYIPPRPLRSENQHLLSIHRSRHTRFSGRSYKLSAPQLWNELPQYLRTQPSLASFKRQLKTHLFRDAYQ